MLDIVQNSLCGIVYAISHSVEIVYKKGSCGSGCLHPCMRHHVEDTFVAVMTDAGDYRQRKVGYVFSQLQRVESCHVAGGATASNYHHAVVFFNLGVYPVEGGNDTDLHSLSLHERIEEGGGETESPCILLQLAAEVTIAGCRA